jgi:hypothetical protein
MSRRRPVKGPPLRAGAGRRRKTTAGVSEERTSAWLITVNTNRSAFTEKELEETEDDMLRVGELMTDRENIEQILTFRRPGYGMDAIKHIDSEGRVEIGGKMSRIHQHILLEITHTIPHPSLFLNIPAIRAFYRENGVTPAVQNTAYVWVRWFQSKKTLSRYLSGAKASVGNPA